MAKDTVDWSLTWCDNEEMLSTEKLVVVRVTMEKDVASMFRQCQKLRFENNLKRNELAD